MGKVKVAVALAGFSLSVLAFFAIVTEGARIFALGMLALGALMLVCALCEKNEKKNKKPIDSRELRW